MANEQNLNATAPLRIGEIRAFAAAWYRKFDEHVSVSDIAPLVLNEGLEFVVPEATLHSRKEFADWYAAYVAAGRPAEAVPTSR